MVVKTEMNSVRSTVGNLREAGGDTEDEAVVGSDPNPAETHVAPEPGVENEYAISEGVTPSRFFSTLISVGLLLSIIL